MLKVNALQSQRSTLRHNRWWAVLMLALIAIGVSLTLIPQEDFWWHMKIGQWISDHGSIPRTGLYSATRADAPFFYQSWLSEWLFAQLYRLGGLPLIAVTRNLLLVTMYAVLAWHAFRRTRNWRAAALAVLLAAAVAFDNWGVRPQTFSWLPFVLTLTILGEVVAERWPRWTLALLPLIEIAWANLHGAFTLGPILVGCVALGASIDRRRDHLEAPTYPTARALWLALGAMLAAMLVNPRGIGVVTYVWTLLTDPSSQQLVSEWVSPFSTLDNPVTQLFFLVLFMTLVLVAVVWRKLRTGDLLLLLALMGLALTGIRYQIWFGLVAGASVAEAIVRRGRLRLITGTAAPPPWLGGIALVLVVIAIGLQPPLRFYQLPAFARGAEGPLPDAELVVAATPIRAVDFLLAHPPSGPLFHEMRYSSYLIWRAGEQIPAFVDTRVELYPLEMWYEYKCISAGRDWQALLAKYNVSTLLLSPQHQQPLIDALAQNAAWQQVYSDEYARIFERDPNAPLPRFAAPTCPDEMKGEG